MAAKSNRPMPKIVASVAPMLIDAGFSRKGQKFNRRRDDVTDALDFQVSIYHWSFTINLGVFVRPLDPDGELRPVGSWIDTPYTHVRERIGTLLPGGVDTWWGVDDIDEAVATVSHAVSRYALPWFDRLSSERVVDARGPDGPGEYWLSLSSAARAHIEAGDQGSARQLLWRCLPENPHDMEDRDWLRRASEHDPDIGQFIEEAWGPRAYRTSEPFGTRTY